MSADGFRHMYEVAAARNRSLLCVGLDPDPAQMPPGVDTVAFLGEIIEATSDLVCCYKPNAACFEAQGAEGWAALSAVIDAVPDGIPVLLDAKRGDVAHTAAFYARAVFEQLGADAVTVNPYLGADALEPFFAYEDRHTFVLCRTSNPSARDVQDLVVGDDDGNGGRPLYEHIALLAKGWNRRGNVGLVVGATYPADIKRIRELCPELLFLVPGIGPQDGELEAAVRGGIDARGGGIIVNVSRGVLYAGAGGEPGGYGQAAREAAASLRDAINAARAEARG